MYKVTWTAKNGNIGEPQTFTAKTEAVKCAQDGSRSGEWSAEVTNNGKFVGWYYKGRKANTKTAR